MEKDKEDNNLEDTQYARWLSGDLSEAELSDLQKDGTLQELEGIIRLTDQASLPAYDIQKGLQRFKKQGLKKAPSPKRRLRKVWIALSAAAAIILLLLVFLPGLVGSNPDTTLTAENGSTLYHEFGEGSNALINDGSSISYNPDSWQESRNVTLKGEAYFDVNPGAPFQISTDYGAVRVLGTQFNVRSWERLSVECYSGKVQVQVDATNFILTEGMALRYDATGKPSVQEIASQEPSWKTGVSRFQRVKVQEVFSELERQFNIQINAQGINKDFTGSFPHSDLEEALDGICRPLGLSFSIDQANNVVSITDNN